MTSDTSLPHSDPRSAWPRDRSRHQRVCCDIFERGVDSLAPRSHVGVRARPSGSLFVPETGDYLIIGAVAAVVTLVATPLVGRLARWRGWLYHPSERTVHTTPIPAIGGLAMFAGFIVALAVAALARPFRLVVRPQLGTPRHRRSRP